MTSRAIGDRTSIALLPNDADFISTSSYTKVDLASAKYSGLSRRMSGMSATRPSRCTAIARTAARASPASIAVHIAACSPMTRAIRPSCGKVSLRYRSTCALTCWTSFPLPLHDRRNRNNLAAARPLRREPHGGLLERLTYHDRLRQSRERNPRGKCARLREYLDQTLIGQLENRFAHRGAADAVRGGNPAFEDRFAGPTFERHDLGAQVGVNHRRNPAQAKVAAPWLARDERPRRGARRLRRGLNGHCEFPLASRLIY